MLIAKVARLQGEIIEAKDADYHDYTGLLLCPACNEPVFLRKAHRRGNTDIPASFVHHKDKKEINKEDKCELRVRQITSSEIKAINIASHNQRLKLLQSNCWEMLMSSPVYQKAKPLISRIGMIDKSFALEMKKKLIQTFNNWGLRLEFEALMLATIDKNIFEGNTLTGYRGNLISVSYEMVRNAQIAKEVVKFCCTAKGKNVLIKMIPVYTVYLYESMIDVSVHEPEKYKDFNPNDLATLFISLLIDAAINWFCSVDWIKQFELIAAKESSNSKDSNHNKAEVKAKAKARTTKSKKES